MEAKYGCFSGSKTVSDGAGRVLMTAKQVGARVRLPCRALGWWAGAPTTGAGVLGGWASLWVLVGAAAAATY